MHELSLCRSLLEIVNEYACREKKRSIKKICLEIGQLSGVDASALRFGFEVIKKGTLAEWAILEIITIEGQARCDTCHKTVTMHSYYDPCQICGQFALTITQGDALRIQSMEVD